MVALEKAFPSKEEVEKALDSTFVDDFTMDEVANSSDFFDMKISPEAIQGRNTYLTEVGNEVYVPDQLLQSHSSLFSDENGDRGSGLYVWAFLSPNPDGSYQVNYPMKFGQFGTDAQNGKLPHETIQEYMSSSNHCEKVIILWASYTESILSKLLVDGDSPEERKREKARRRIRQNKEKFKNAKQLEGEIRNKYLTDASGKMGSGTEWVEGSIGDLIEAVGEYIGSKHVVDGTNRYKLRNYIEENDEQYAKFLREIDGVEVDKDGYILAATTGLGKTAMALRMIRDYASKGFTSANEDEGTFNAIFSSMPDTLVNFLDDAENFPGEFDDKDGNCRLKFYGGKSVLKEFRKTDHENIVYGGVDEFVKAKENNESGIHIMMWSVQDVKDKTEYEEEEDPVTQEDVEEFAAKLTGKYSVLEDFEWDVLVFDEAHYATDTERMYKSLECFGSWHHRILLSATPQIYFENEDRIHREPHGLFTMTRDEVYRLKRSGASFLQNRPDYTYRFLFMKQAIKQLRDQFGLEEEDDWTPSKFMSVEESDSGRKLKYRERIKELFRIILDIKANAQATEHLSPYRAAGDKEPLCDYSKRVGMFVAPRPAGGGEGGARWLVEELVDELLPAVDDGEEFIFLNAYNDDDVEKLAKFGEAREEGNVSANHPWKGKKIILVTHRKRLVGYDEEQLGWMMIFQDMGTAQLFEQATGRIGREGPKALDSDVASNLKKENCAAYVVASDGGYEVLNKRRRAEEMIRDREVDPVEYSRELRELYDIAFAKLAENGNLKWKDFEYTDFVSVAKEGSTSQEKAIVSNVEKLIRDKDLFSPGNITDKSIESVKDDLFGKQSGGSSTKNGGQKSSGNGSSNKNNNESEIESQANQIKNFIEYSLDRIGKLIWLSNFDGEHSFKHFVKMNEYDVNGRKRKLSDVIDSDRFDLGGRGVKEVLLYYYNEGALDKEKLHEWFAKQMSL